MKPEIKLTVTDEDSFARSFGITPEREIELDAMMEKCHADTNTYPDAINEIAPFLENANELAYSCFHLGAFAEHSRSKHELLHKLLAD